MLGGGCAVQPRQNGSDKNKQTLWFLYRDELLGSRPTFHNIISLERSLDDVV